MPPLAGRHEHTASTVLPTLIALNPTTAGRLEVDLCGALSVPMAHPTLLLPCITQYDSPAYSHMTLLAVLHDAVSVAAYAPHASCLWAWSPMTSASIKCDQGHLTHVISTNASQHMHHQPHASDSHSWHSGNNSQRCRGPPLASPPHPHIRVSSRPQRSFH